MQNRHSTILRKVNSSLNVLNVLTYPTHEAVQEGWSFLPHTFYLFQGEGIKTWNENYRKLPNNHILLDGSKGQVRPDMNFDLVLCQNKASMQGKISKQVSEQLGIPCVNLEHCYPWPGSNERQIEQVKQLKFDLEVFITKDSMGKWGYLLKDNNVRILEHGINTDIFKPTEIDRENWIFTCVNLWKDRDNLCGFNLGQRLIKDLPNKHLGSSNDGSTMEAKDRQDLINHYDKCGVFLNTSLWSPCPHTLLEACSMACPIVSTYNSAVKFMFKNEEHGWFNNDEGFMRDRLEWCLKNPKDAREMGLRARKLITETYNIKNHCLKLDEILKEAL